MLGVGWRPPTYLLHGTCSPEGMPSTHPVRPLPDNTHSEELRYHYSPWHAMS